ncbi:hypothetical protein AAMO2058_000687800 [Amorphochlora amoebiformis]
MGKGPSAVELKTSHGVGETDKIQGIDLEWVKLSVDLPASKTTKMIVASSPELDSKGKKSSMDRCILSGVSGVIRAGELSCIMGPSGSGKTTLMQTLAGRQSLPWRGKILANGTEIKVVEFRKNIAFVMQEEALYPTQTPREAFKFSVSLRLKGLDETRRDEVVNNIIEELDLGSCADSLIGNELIRGISGGEKRRVSIGVELITNPKILFLDEPTSGLDSSSALSVVMTLKRLCRRGCSVMCTIHQPSSEAFHEFDKVFLLKDGRMVFGGSIPQMSTILNDVGLGCPPTYNIADHMLTVIKQKGEKGVLDVEKITLAWKKLDAKSDGPDGKTEPNSPSGSAEHHQPLIKYEIQSGFFAQMHHLQMRDIKNVWRDKSSLGFRVAATAFLNILFGVVFLDVGNDDVIASRYGGLLLISINAMFATSQPQLTAFVIERASFLREYQVGTFGIAPYFLSKFFVDLVVTLFQTLLGCVCSVFAMGLKGNFFAIWMSVYLLAIVAESQTTLIGCVVTNVKDAMELMPLAFVPQLLFAGFFVRIEQIPIWLRWVQWLCSLKYAVNLVLIVEFEGDDSTEVENLLDDTNVERDLVWLYVGMLIVLMVVFRVVAAIALGYMAK